jgi:hypothetical protein
VKIPATSEGVEAVEEMIAEGRSINVTLLFSLLRYGEILDAYLSGLERFARRGGDLASVQSVASFFVSRVDTVVDRQLEEIGTPQALALRGQAADRAGQGRVPDVPRGALGCAMGAPGRAGCPRATPVVGVDLDEEPRPGPKASSDLADIIDLMLATGARIGEVLAVRWVDVELDATRPSLAINGTIKTEAGKGTYRKASPKSDASVRTVVLPGFAIAVLKRRHAAAPGDPNAPVFPTRNGTWQQVNNVERPLATGAEGHRPRMGHASHVPQDRRDPHLGAGRCRERLAAARPLLPRHHARVLHLQASDRCRRRTRPRRVGRRT